MKKFLIAFSILFTVTVYAGNDKPSVTGNDGGGNGGCGVGQLTNGCGGSVQVIVTGKQ